MVLKSILKSVLKYTFQSKTFKFQENTISKNDELKINIIKIDYNICDNKKLIRIE